MQWVYRLQQRIAITRGECNVILVLAFLFGLGLAARYVQSQAEPHFLIGESGIIESESLRVGEPEKKTPDSPIVIFPECPKKFPRLPDSTIT